MPSSLEPVYVVVGKCENFIFYSYMEWNYLSCTQNDGKKGENNFQDSFFTSTRKRMKITEEKVQFSPIKEIKMKFHLQNNFKRVLKCTLRLPQSLYVYSLELPIQDFSKAIRRINFVIYV